MRSFFCLRQITVDEIKYSGFPGIVRPYKEVKFSKRAQFLHFGANTPKELYGQTF